MDLFLMKSDQTNPTVEKRKEPSVGKVVTQSIKTEYSVGRKGQKNMSVLGTTHFKQEIKNRKLGLC